VRRTPNASVRRFIARADYKIVDPGKVCLGGNDAPGTGANYLVLAGPMVDLTRAPTHRVEITNLVSHSSGQPPYVAQADTWRAPYTSAMGVGDSYYADWADVKLGSLPPFLHSLVGIKTNNGDKFADGGDGEFLCFDVDEPVRVYLLYDQRVVKTGVPAWVTEKFHDHHEETADSGTGNDQRSVQCRALLHRRPDSQPVTSSKIGHP
jgi:hypothetical protein